ncbi:DUF4136 domain-containing protein, partial [Xanthovirga aplysinae]|uniref:DUF4136 domain-containing protein n=1 Tax=Xanthovirga aplysinae TaxID=2529853 RepID=UPI0012BD13B8
WGWGWGYPYPIRIPYQYNKGTLVVSFLDTNSNRIIWHASADRSLKRANVAKKDILKTVHEVFKRYPGRVHNISSSGELL